jgi:hypothetical protein
MSTQNINKRGVFNGSSIDKKFIQNGSTGGDGVIVTFPIAFDHTPLILLQPIIIDSTPPVRLGDCSPVNITMSGFKLRQAISSTVNWFAIDLAFSGGGD